MKIAPLVHAIQKAQKTGQDIQYRFVHMGQHYERQMRTCTIGTNELIGTNPDNIKPVLGKLFAGLWKKGGIPPLWD